MPSSVVDIVKAYFGTFSLMTADKAALFLADDFQLVGLTAHPMDKQAWVGFMKALKNAIPDLKIKLSEIKTEENVVKLTYYGVGTHRGAMDLSALNLPAVPASNKTVTFPSGQWSITVVEGKITQETFVSPVSPETGMAGMIKAFSAV